MLKIIEMIDLKKKLTIQSHILHLYYHILYFNEILELFLSDIVDLECVSDEEQTVGLPSNKLNSLYKCMLFGAILTNTLIT